MIRNEVRFLDIASQELDDTKGVLDVKYTDK